MPTTEVKRKAIPKSVRIKVYEKYNGHCAYCGCELEMKEMQVDHVESLYWYGGEDDIKNYMPSCRSCNFYKGTLTLKKFRQQLQSIPQRLEKEFIYRLAKSYGLVLEAEKPIQFYFEILGSKDLEITVDEKCIYDGLKGIAKRCGYRVGVCKNEQTDKEFDDAINELIMFEKEHGIVN